MCFSLPGIVIILGVSPIKLRTQAGVDLSPHPVLLLRVSTQECYLVYIAALFLVVVVLAAAALSKHSAVYTPWASRQSNLGTGDSSPQYLQKAAYLSVSSYLSLQSCLAT